MSRNASGVYTLPTSVNPVVSKTTITTNWWTTTSADIANEITLSLDRSGRGAMQAPLQVPDGTASLPTLTFSNDTNTGAYRVGADTLGFTTGGTLRAQIGTQLLTIDGALATPAVSFISDTNTGIYRAGADDLRIVAGGTEFVKVNLSGAGAGKTSLSAATAASGGTRQDALSLTNGDLDLSAVTAPDSTTSVANRLTPSNLVKAWCVVTIVGGSGGAFTPTVNEAFNITSVARAAATSLTVTIGADFAGTTYGVIGQVINGLIGADQYLVNPTTRAAGTLTVGLTSAGGGAVNLDTSADTVQMVLLFIGAQ